MRIKNFDVVYRDPLFSIKSQETISLDEATKQMCGVDTMTGNETIIRLSSPVDCAMFIANMCSLNFSLLTLDMCNLRSGKETTYALDAAHNPINRRKKI